MESLNRMALELADEALEFTEELDIGALELDTGTTVIDFGVEHDGGLEAGLLLAELQTAGLATVQTRVDTVGDATFPHVEVACDQPAVAMLGAQKAGWELAVDDYEALGSGPARALVATEGEFQAIDYVDAFEFAVLTLESTGLPTTAAASEVAARAGVTEESVFLPTYRTASVAGSVSAAARTVELAVFRLYELGYDPTDVLSASGCAPVAPVAGDEQTAIGRTNDALAHGGRVHLTVAEDFDAFDAVVSSAAARYDDPFAEVVGTDDWDAGDVDNGVFGPAQLTVDVVGGPTHAFGTVREDVLADGFGLS
ncbi:MULTISPECIES: methenyltetrahydromethanopterin cyclohydrolase [Halobacterium]|uniref:methenyltetrahydromethanopterin cyclohydrolase n=1 Tax=Halobacterium TaxID=2239 RepID=UPI001966BF65|nr:MULTISPECIES: methenyltetrahydromethanopterin cyclohydrolase [Halobacterium]MDL0126939.1 methenyltetrahydromethanopterin cyclohydrolase [Halobacterium salinarum]QRY24074.1 methenyltetrahydromethanopterin cyclohydrolase [Halobacterium sp. BOL4-2]